MRKYIILLAIFCTSAGIKAQKLEISYGTVMGLNTTFFSSKSGVNHNYPFHELDQNFNLTTSNEPKIGYNIGVFFNIKPVESRFNFESGISVARYNNSYKLSLNYDEYSSTSSVDYWVSETVTEIVNNEFNVISIPLNVGYDVYLIEKYQICVFGGLSANIDMNNDHVTVDMNMNEHYLYKTYFMSYQGGFRARLNKIICKFKYERSLNIQEASSSEYFPWEMNVEKLYLNIFSISVGYMFN